MADNVDFDLESEFGVADGYKDLHCLQQQNVGKLSRGELEDLYYQLHHENIEVKKKFNTLDSKYKLMAARVVRISRDHKCINSVTREEEQNQLRLLRQSEASLKAKLTVLRGQLSSHTRLHSAALSKSIRPRSHRCSRGCHPRCCSSCSGDDMPPDSGHTSSHNFRHSHNHSNSRCGSHSCGGASDREQDESGLKRKELQQQVTNLQERVSVLQKDMELASKQSRQRIRELETELSTYLSGEVAENVELIRARRACKQHEASLITLQQEYQAMQRELQTTKAALVIAARDQDEVCKALTREKQRSADFQQEIIMITHNSSSLRELQEQLNDLKKENSVLKAHSNQLLQLTTGNTDGLRGAGEGEQVKDSLDVHQKLQKEAANIQEECKRLELKVVSLHKEQAEIQHKLVSAGNDITVLQKQLIETHSERNQLQKQLSEARTECKDLQKELVEPCEERNRLKQQLSDIQNECIKLEEDIEKRKLNLQHLEQSIPLPQEPPPTSVRVGNSMADQGTQPKPSSCQLTAHHPAPIQQALHSVSQPFRNQNPQQWPFYPTQYTIPLSARSQPVTPRTHSGDACLALLEQTALRSPMDAVLGTHGSLQERFLELCVSTASPTIPSTPMGTPAPAAASTPLPTVTCELEPIKGKQPFEQGSEGDMGHLHEEVSSYKVERSPGKALGEADTAWELDRCRELLRVQCQLNSMYKKEVTSLNHIVKTFTTRPSSTER